MKEDGFCLEITREHEIIIRLDLNFLELDIRFRLESVSFELIRRNELEHENTF